MERRAGRARGAEAERAAELDAVPERESIRHRTQPAAAARSAKNVPENMYIGMITKRKTVLICRAERTADGPCRGRRGEREPGQSAAGSTASAHQPSETPNTAMTATKAALEVSTRNAMNSRCPPMISDGSSGVVAAAR